MPKEFTRPKEGFRFAFGGVRVNDTPDAFPPGKYALGVNIRAYSGSSIRTRPGLTTLFSAGTAMATDLRAYTALSTDDLPRILMRDAADKVWLDNGVQVGTLAGSGGTLGAAMIPFRPNASPNPWMYIANGNDYQKFSAPTAANVVTQQKAGIAEPQASLDASPLGQTFEQFLPSGSWAAGGTASGPTVAARSTDTILNAALDPAQNVARWSLEVGTTVQYQIGEVVKFFINIAHTTSYTTIIEDVIPPLGGTLSIAAIYYFAGATGHCVIVLGGTGAVGRGTPASKAGIRPVLQPVTQLPSGGGPGGVFSPPASASGSGPQGSAINQAAQGLRRGAFLELNPGGGTQETVYILSVTEGPDNSICVETTTTNPHAIGELITSLPTIIVNNVPLGGAPQGTITGDPNKVAYSQTTGLGTLTATLNLALTALPDDYFHFSVLLDAPQNVSQISVLLDCGDGSFTQNYYYYSVAPSYIVGVTQNTATQTAAVQEILQQDLVEQLGTADGLAIASQSVSGASQWTEVWLSLREFTRVGGDQTKTIYQSTKIQIQIESTGSVSPQISSITAVGGSNPDVGDIGSPYFYRIRPRSSVTGAMGNPSPNMRYGVIARRQAVEVQMPSPYADPQADTWDIFRFGGTVTSWRYIGSVPIGSSPFTDNFDDQAAEAGDALEFDNFEPWPTIDLPLNVLGGTLIGTELTFALLAANANLARYLPGNLVSITPTPGLGTLMGPVVLTLRTRPVSPDASNINWLFEFVECGGYAFSAGVMISLYEPDMANQPLPYLWGPDAAGTVFAAGDPLRAGTLYLAKNNNPDSAPDSYNIEITAPTEPLQGGEVMDGLAFVASTKWWWALYPQPDNPTQRYNVVKQPMTRGLAAAYGHCNDGTSIYWWATDGIYSSSDGSLTDTDLYTVFPHEGIPGKPRTYNGGNVILPPDYSQAPKFRLTYANGYLYATYPYVGGGGAYAPVLVCNLRTKAWSTDAYGGVYGVSAVYQIEQQAESAGVLNAPLLIAGTTSPILTNARIFTQTDLANDNLNTPITAQVGTYEFDGGDVRAPKQWGDVFLDCTPVAGITATPMSLGAPVAAATVVPASASRVRTPVSVGGIVVSDFLGLLLTWTDNYATQTSVTNVYVWQPSFVDQPARDLSWYTFGSAFGLKGYIHLRQLTLAWVSTAPITLTATPYDGQAPAPIVIPSSGGAYQKAVFPFSANKGLLFAFKATSTAQFQIFNDDSELYVGQWNREEPYAAYRGFGGRTMDDAPI